MGFEKVPNEIIEHIFNHLEQQDLVVISRTCRKFNNFVEPNLYSTVKQTGRGLTSSLIQTLLMKPELARYVKDVTLEETDYDLENSHKQLYSLDLVPAKWETFTAKLHQFFEACQDPSKVPHTPASVETEYTLDKTEEWLLERSRTCNWEALTSCLLLFLPCIQKLSIESFFGYQDWVLNILVWAGRLQSHTVVSHAFSFLSLSELTLQGLGQERLELNIIYRLLLIPSLRKFTCQNAVMTDTEFVFEGPSYIRQLVLLDYAIPTYRTHMNLAQILTKCIYLESLTIESATFLSHQRQYFWFKAMSHLHLGLKELILLEVGISVYEDAGEDVLPKLTLFGGLQNLEILGHSINYFHEMDSEFRDEGIAPYDFSAFPPNLVQLTLRKVVPEHFIRHFLPSRGNATIPASVLELRRIHVEFDPDVTNNIHHWPFLAWKYRQLGITISWENGNSLNEAEGEVYEFTHDFDHLLQTAQDDENVEHWASGYEDERKIVERPQRLRLNLD